MLFFFYAAPMAGMIAFTLHLYNDVVTSTRGSK